MNFSKGFSLVEIAVVLVIISVLLIIVAAPIGSQLDLRRFEDIKKQEEVLKETILGFAVINGRLPCPALNAGACTVGRECFCAEGTGLSVSSTCTLTLTMPANFNGRCAAFGTTSTALAVGLLPAMSLGIASSDDNGYLLDAFLQPNSQYRYAVSRTTVNSVVFPLTRVDGIKLATMDSFGGTSPPTFLTICPPSTPACSGSARLTTQAPFVVVSLGKNSATAFASLGAAEQGNLDDDAGHTFVSGAPVASFDDVLSWSSINILFARMVQAGKLP